MPRPPRFFISSDQVSGSRIVVLGDDIRHISTVLRKKTGDMLSLLDNTGTEYIVRIESIDRASIETAVVRQQHLEHIGPRIILGQGLPKADKMDWIIQKATELGVSSIVPLVTERTIIKIKDEQKRILRWQKIAKEAAMQSTRAEIPVVEPVRSYTDFIGNLRPAVNTLLLFPWENSTSPIKQVLSQNQKAQNIILLIGPEGGFSAGEAEAAQAAGFHLVSLGPFILRTETAAVAALSMILYETFSGISLDTPTE